MKNKPIQVERLYDLRNETAVFLYLRAYGDLGECLFMADTIIANVWIEKGGRL